MKIVIDIAKNEYDALDKLNAEYLLHIIKDGTTLPKGHGALKDADELINKCAYDLDNNFVIDLIDVRNAPTIIEADKEGAEND